MSWKAEAQKIYEARVVTDVLAKLTERFDVRQVPFSEEELQILAKRARELFRNPEKKRERLDRYKAHLSAIHGAELVGAVSSALEEINNAIGYEEK